jgi:hypothetical protein
MTKHWFLGAAAVVLSSALAAPAMAQQAVSHPGLCSQHHPNANCMTKGRGNPYISPRRGQVAYRNNGWNNGWNDSWNDDRWDHRDHGFWPGDVAAGVVGGALATAGAAADTAGEIATAPFGDSYAYDNDGYYNSGWNGWNNQSYAQRNGFVCTPGTWFKGEDGRNHICQ